MPTFEYFGFWVVVDGKLNQIPTQVVEVFFKGTNALKADAVKLNCTNNKDIIIYYYGDSPVSDFKLFQIGNKDKEVQVNIAPLEKPGTFKIKPAMELSNGIYYTFHNKKTAYTFILN
jgi:hypothetical protein